MYICKDCFETFDNPVTIAEDFTPGGSSEGGSFIYKYSGCPFCGGAYEEIKICDICDTAIKNNDYELINKNGNILTCCKMCYEEEENVQEEN